MKNKIFLKIKIKKYYDQNIKIGIKSGSKFLK